MSSPRTVVPLTLRSPQTRVTGSQPITASRRAPNQPTTVFSLGQRGEDCVNCEQVDGFDEVVMEPRLPRFLPITFLPVSGDRNQRDAPEFGDLAQSRRQLVPIHDRKPEIEKRDRRTEFTSSTQSG